MADYLVNTEEMVEALPSRRERHQGPKKKRKIERARPELLDPKSEQEKEGPERSKIFKRERERQGSLFVASFIFWLFILLVGSVLFFTIRHYS
jgi:hypothetical protein